MCLCSQSMRCSVLTMIALWAGFALPGCGGGAKAFAPRGASAREALDATLTAWKNGEKPDALASRSPAVHAVDSHWRSGQSLQSFEVVQEEAGEGVQRFSVKLTTKEGGAKSKDVHADATYVVVGRDPVWVYRDDDYARLLGMEDNPQPRKGSARQPR